MGASGATSAPRCFEFLEHRDFGFVHQILAYRRDQEGSLSAFSKRFNTYFPSSLYELIVYRPKYLSEDERRRRIREHLRDYYRYLGGQVYRRRGHEFWSFHRGKLAALGCPLSVAADAAAYALDLLLNPKRTVESALDAVRRRRSARSPR